MTGGPTRELLDPVRFLSNRSSGKMSFALADAIQKKDFELHFVCGPVCFKKPKNCYFYRVNTALEMYKKVHQILAKKKIDIIIMAAAVSDYRPEQIYKQKIKKNKNTLELKLIKNPDILKSVRKKHNFKGLLVGFAAETQNIISNAQNKLKNKNCDVIILNDVSKKSIGFESNYNEVLIINNPKIKKGENIFHLPKKSKNALAINILEYLLKIYKAKKN